MHGLIRNITMFGLFMVFVFNGSLLNLVGWDYLSDVGSPLFKIHPGFYIFTVTSILLIFSNDPAFLRIFREKVFIFYLMMALILCAVAAYKAHQGGAINGQLSVAIVTYLMPAIALISLQSISQLKFSKVAIYIRLFLLINSVIGISERIVGFRFVPSFIDDRRIDDRAAALMSHPLNGALVTGLIVVYLFTASLKRGEKTVYRFPEIALHAVALFAFGGRAALVGTAVCCFISNLISFKGRDGGGLSALQRILPFLLPVAGAVVIASSSSFVADTIDRFSSAQKSSQVRDVSYEIITTMPYDQIAFGISSAQRDMIFDLYNISAIEIAPIALIMTFGALVVLPLLFSLFILLISLAKELDRSAMWMTFLFFMVTTSSLSIGSKSLLITQFIVMMLALCGRQQLSEERDL